MVDFKDVQLPDGFNLSQVSLDKVVKKKQLLLRCYCYRRAEIAVKALLKYAAKSKDDSLFMDAPVRMLMDVKAFKTTEGTENFFNIRLPHPPHTELTELDVLLVVPDVPDRDPDHVVGEVKDELMNSTHAEKIKVREIMTLKQFRDDYAPYEAKRALSKSVDVVIADNKIWKMIPGILGREFAKKMKFPLATPGRKFKKEDIGSQIWFSLHKTVLNLSLNGQTSSLVVGQDNLTEQELVDNVSTIVSWIGKNFPGGWQNIQKLSLHIGQSNMPPLPIYSSEGTRNEVEKRPKSKRPIVAEPVEGEISTQLGKLMKILPTGSIRVLKSKERDELDDIL